MAKRSDMTSKLSKPAGWQDQVSASAPDTSSAPVPQYKRKTYLLTEELINRIEELADRERLQLNELVRWLLTDALDRIDAGETELPTQTVERRTLG